MKFFSFLCIIITRSNSVTSDEIPDFDFANKAQIPPYISELYEHGLSHSKQYDHFLRYLKVDKIEASIGTSINNANGTYWEILFQMSRLDVEKMLTMELVFDFKNNCLNNDIYLTISFEQALVHEIVVLFKPCENDEYLSVRLNKSWISSFAVKNDISPWIIKLKVNESLVPANLALKEFLGLDQPAIVIYYNDYEASNPALDPYTISPDIKYGLPHDTRCSLRPLNILWRLAKTGAELVVQPIYMTINFCSGISLEQVRSRNQINVDKQVLDHLLTSNFSPPISCVPSHLTSEKTMTYIPLAKTYKIYKVPKIIATACHYEI